MSSPVATLDPTELSGYSASVQHVTATVTDADNTTSTFDTTGMSGGMQVVQTTTIQVIDPDTIFWSWESGLGGQFGQGFNAISFAMPDESDVLIFTATSSTGNVATAKCVVTVKRKTGHGADVPADTPAMFATNLAGLVGNLPARGITKLFTPVNKGLPNPTKYAVPAGMTRAALPHRPGARPGVHCLHPGLHRLRPPHAGHLAAGRRPGQGLRRRVVLRLPAAPRRPRAGRRLHPGGPVQILPNLTGYWQAHNGNWAQVDSWIPKHPLITGVGFDLYPGGQSGWDPLKTMLEPAAAAANRHGLDLHVPEWGVVVPLSPTAADFRPAPTGSPKAAPTWRRPRPW